MLVFQVIIAIVYREMTYLQSIYITLETYKVIVLHNTKQIQNKNSV